ncbi:hypothetical protein HYQ16_gp59, partial [Lactococcus phage CHPC959]
PGVLCAENLLNIPFKGAGIYKKYFYFIFIFSTKV